MKSREELLKEYNKVLGEISKSHEDMKETRRAFEAYEKTNAESIAAGEKLLLCIEALLTMPELPK